MTLLRRLWLLIPTTPLPGWRHVPALADYVLEEQEDR